jgi:Mn2+/Fe2+ NRAMP family transporter
VAAALEPIAGGGAKVLFAVGFVSAGLLAIPVLAGSASAGLAGVLGCDWGFSRAVPDAPLFYAVVAGGTITGSILSVAGVDPIRLLVAAATGNGITAAPLLAVVMVIAGDRRLLGEHRPHLITRVLGWAAVALMGSATAALAVAAW